MATLFHDVNGMRESISKLPNILWLSSAEVAKIGMGAVEAGKVRVISGTPNNIITWMTRYLPDFSFNTCIASETASGQTTQT